jgi:hypothetical protein
MPAPTYLVDERLKEWATEAQKRAIDAVNEHRSIGAAARALGLNKSSIRDSIALAKKKAAIFGYSPSHDMTRTVPEPYVVKGVSTYYNKEGKPSAQWVKSSLDDDKARETLRAAILAMQEDIPRLPKLPAPSKHLAPHLCSCYVITDYHLSMLAHHEEAGDDWDLKIAEKTLVDWFAQAIAQSPASETAVFAQLSDLLHADGIEPLTPASKHLLDVDSRFYKVVRVVIRLLRQIIDMLLAKHAKLHIIMADANHDPVSQIWLREWIAVLYENEPRISVDRSPSPYNAFEFGKVALFFHHGHRRKVENVSDVFASQFRELFGRTKFAYAHMGHLHNLHVKENNLMLVEQHRTLAARDAYAARGGWLSGRDAQVITYHRDFGEVSRVKVSSDMVRAAA